MDEEERNAYRRLIRVDVKGEANFALTYAALVDSLKTLCRLLEKHYQRKVIVLIDEYDVPLDKAFQSVYYDKMIGLIRNMLGNVLKTYDSLYYAVLTGCLRISKPIIFTGLNNLKIHTVSDTRCDEYFGFTDEDVDELLADPTIPPKNYWANTSGNTLILRLLQKADQTTKDQIEELINGGPIMKSIRQELTYRGIDDSVDNIWSVLYEKG